MKVLKFILGLILAIPLFGQFAQHVAPGDPCFTASLVWPSPSLQYAPSFGCTLNVPAGDYQITYTLQEPTVTGPGQRVFTVWANGTISPSLDLYQMAKQAPVKLVQRVYMAAPGPLVFSFLATIRNAVVSAIDVLQLPTFTPAWLVNTGTSIFGEMACPAGWTNPVLQDGNCLTIALLTNGPKPIITGISPQTIPTGVMTLITITGSGFTGTTGAVGSDQMAFSTYLVVNDSTVTVGVLTPTTDTTKQPPGPYPPSHLISITGPAGS